MQIEDLQVVLKVAEFRSITAAALHLDMQVATASAALKRVEAQLGTELFIRTTRQLRLSSSGEKYIPQCEQALLMLDSAKQNIKNDQAIIDGELRIALSSDFGRNLAIPWLDEFMEQHPNLSIRTHMSDSNIDFYRDSLDMAIRYGSPNDANLYGFKICNVPRLLCATPNYLKKHGTPKHPQDLPTHNALLYQLHDITHDVWTFYEGETQHKIKVSGNRITNDSDLVRRWCTSGKGLAAKSCFDMANDLLAGRVVSLMPGFKPAATEMWLIFPSRQSITPAARLLRDLLKEKSTQVLKQLIAKGVISQDALLN